MDWSVHAGLFPRYPGEVRIEVLSAVGRWDHFASLMVPRKAGGGGCVCMAYRNSSLDTPGRIAHMRGLCEREPGPGVLAFVDGEVVGWCSIAPKATYRALVNSRTIPHVDDGDAWSAVCFVVRTGFRRRGLMHELLDGAVEHARVGGAIVIEGYPVEPDGDRVDQTAAYVGTVGLFEAHGFERVLQTKGRSGGKPRWLVRRAIR
ncbi:MAG TPA: GNAT family N-acetyltransferase [Streptosporangiaceae bacterium]|jgi:GNAT superfamily N-acetyltransferase|nr:GNAT family N-acetyltransferase [Streptosporangiaceae bacterium]